MLRRSAGAKYLLHLMVGSLLTGGLFSSAVVHAATLPVSPSRQVLVVTAPLKEIEDADVRRTGDMKQFVSRLIDAVPYDPDVLLLQEVQRRSARFVASELTDRLGSKYRAVVSPVETWRQTRRKVIKTETAILLNTETMNTLHSGGYIGTGFGRKAAAPGVKPETKRNAFMLAGEAGSGLTVPLVSVHLSLERNMRSERISHKKRKQWVQKIVSKMRSRYPAKPDRARVVGGDFNSGRCDRDTKLENCRILPFWRAMAGSGHRDALWTVERSLGVDIVFTNKSVIDADIDPSMDQPWEKDSSDYSDHAFRWALVGGNDSTPPTTPGLDAESWKANDPVTRVEWSRAQDSWSALDGYDVWKSSDGEHFKKLMNTQETSRIDRNVREGKTYWYYVRSVDGAGNKSPRSNISRVVAGRG